MSVTIKNRRKTFSKKIPKKSLKNGGRKKKTYTLKKKQNKRKKRISGAGDALSDEEIDEILKNFYSMSEEKKSEAKKLLRNLAFDPNYTKDCFGSRLPKHPDDELTLLEQAESKVQCWDRYNDKIE